MEPSTRSAKDLFADSLEMDSAQREAFLRRQCAGDTAKYHEVKRLLEAHDRAGGFLASPTGPIPPAAAPSSAAQEERAGAMIDRYKLLQLIGEGGFGQVFMAEQRDPVSRKVALKLIKLGMDTKQVIARFEAERQALAMMDHPNIARVLDAGATPSGRPYFVMELVRGDPITQYCDTNNLRTTDRLALFMQVCHAVQHAHQKGIIHRDIKPNNVLVTVIDGRPVPKVIDFGIAKATHSRLTEKTVFTEFRQLIGTPEYMSPEQAEMSGVDIDTRSDIYSLGVLLYELLTGVTPFDGRKLRSAAWGELQRIIREEEPPRPSTRLSTMKESIGGVAAHRAVDPARLIGLVRGDLDWIVMRCLEKDRTRRYDTASGLAADIDRFLSGAAVQAAPPTAGYRMRKFIRRHRGPVIAGCLVGAALLLGLAGTTAGMLRAESARREAEDQATIAQQNSQRADQAAKAAEAAQTESKARADELEQVVKFQASQLTEMDPQTMGTRLREDLLAELRKPAPVSAEAVDEAGEARQRAELDELIKRLDTVNFTNLAVKQIDQSMLSRAVQAVQEQFKDQPIVKARLLQTLADTQSDLGLFDQATAPQAEALSIRRRVLGLEHPETVKSIANQATLFRLQDKMREAETLYTEAYETSRRALGNDHDLTLSAVINMSSLRSMQGKTQEAEALAREAIEMSKRIRGEKHKDTGGAYSNLAFLVAGQGKLDEAVALMRQSLAIRREAAGDVHADTLDAINNLAFMLQETGKLDEAEALYRESYEGNRALRGDDHPATLRAENNIGSVLRAKRNLPESEKYFRKTLEARMRLFGPAHEETISSMANLGVLLNDSGKREEALPYYLQVYEARLRTQGADDPSTLQSMSNLGFIMDNLGRREEAEKYTRGAYEGRLRVLGPKHVDTLVSANNYAMMLMQRGDLEKSEPIFREVLEQRLATIGPAHARTLTSKQNLALLLYKQKKLDDAETLAREAMTGRMTTLGPIHPNSLESRVRLAEIHVDQGKFEEAEGEVLSLEKDLREGPGGAKGAAYGRALELLAKLYTTWDGAEPGKGHDTQAAEWKAKLPAPVTPTIQALPR